MTYANIFFVEITKKNKNIGTERENMMMDEKWNWNDDVTQRNVIMLFFADPSSAQNKTKQNNLQLVATHQKADEHLHSKLNLDFDYTS